MLGTHVLISAQERSTIPGGLREAAFWVGVRQEVYNAFVNQRSFLPSLEHSNIDRSFEPADDVTWVNRIVVTCADVLRWCFGEGDHSIATYNQLLEYCSNWMIFKPPSFAPIHLGEASEDAVFPEIWLLNGFVTAGLQYYHLTKVLLTAHNPKLPRLGPGQKAASRIMDEELKYSIVNLCGLAESNTQAPPVFV